MKILSTLALLATLLSIVGCTDPDHYPISGQECNPGDPVQTLDANDCMPPV